MKPLTQVFATAFGCFLLYALLVSVRPSLAARMSESGVINSIIRCEDLARKPNADMILVGSSLTGRLDAGVAAGGSDNAVQLGLEGLGAAYGLSVLERLDARSKVLVVEANFLDPDGSGNPAENPNAGAIEQALNSPFFRLRARIPVLSSRYRPSSVVYYRLKDRYSDRPSGGERPAIPAVAATSDPAGCRQSDEPRYSSRTRRALQRRHEHLMVVWLPDNRERDPERLRKIRCWADELGATFVDAWDLLKDYPLEFSDGLHLTLESGRVVSELIESARPERLRSR